MGKLTTHVLDLVRGTPGKGIRIDLYRVDGETREHLASRVTNDDGRVDSPLLEAGALTAGTYESVFQAGEYLRAKQPDYQNREFLDEIVIRFCVADANQHYHVPLLLSNFGYSTYRGS
ncbi:MAG: hydroxyisourate hydrolase [Acidiferrobacterales bacterium]|nr:hydroxyisourate hydrolase [Acidiferrobacterales bacterium]